MHLPIWTIISLHFNIAARESVPRGKNLDNCIDAIAHHSTNIAASHPHLYIALLHSLNYISATVQHNLGCRTVRYQLLCSNLRNRPLQAWLKYTVRIHALAYCSRPTAPGDKCRRYRKSGQPRFFNVLLNYYITLYNCIGANRLYDYGMVWAGSLVAEVFGVNRTWTAPDLPVNRWAILSPSSLMA